MNKSYSDMTSAELVAWSERHRFSYKTGAEALGVSRRQYAAYLAGDQQIPQPIALLCGAIDREARAAKAKKSAGAIRKR